MGVNGASECGVGSRCPALDAPCRLEGDPGPGFLSTGLLPPAFRDAPSLLISVAAAWHRAVIKPWAAIGNQGLAASPRGDRCRGEGPGFPSAGLHSGANVVRAQGMVAHQRALPLSAIMRRVAWYGTARAANRARPPSLLGHRRRGISRPLGLGQFILLCNVKLHVSHLIDEQ